MKEFKIGCPHCQQHIAFSESNVGQVIACPSCGLSVGLNVPGYTPQKKTHGVFYYVFWGVVSLIGTIVILSAVWVLFLGGLIAYPTFVKAKHDSHQNNVGKEISATNTITTTAEDLLKKEKADYFSQIELTDLSAHYHDTYDGRKAGVIFRLKNNGEKTLKRIEVTVYFLDRNNNPVYDEKFYPVSVNEYSKDTPLRPSYVWQLDQEHFLPVSRAMPDEWEQGNAKAEITDIDFMDEK